jgi:hypothetical protein
MLKRYLFSIFSALFILSSTTDAEQNLADGFKSMLGNFEASCENMVLAESISEDNDILGAARKLPFDVAACEKILHPVSVEKIYAPLLKQYSQIDLRHTSNFLIVRKMRNLVLDFQNKRMIKTLHVNALSLAEACRKASVGINQGKSHLCYFGAPDSHSSDIFKVLFNTMLADTLPSNETLCSPQPLEKRSAVSIEFKRMLGKGNRSQSWPKIQNSIIADGFYCREDSCTRPIFGIVLPAQKQIATADSNLGFAIVPRLLQIYRGKWSVVGPPSFCIAKDGKGRCSQPSRGVGEGICIAKEDGHMWGYLFYGMNGSSE